MTESTTVIGRDMGGRWRERTDYKGTFWGDENILYLDCGGGHRTVHIC